MTVAIEQPLKERRYFRCAECKRIRKIETGENVSLRLCNRCVRKQTAPILYALEYVPAHYFRKEKMRFDRPYLQEVEQNGR